jgi:hypothetical protein
MDTVFTGSVTNTFFFPCTNTITSYEHGTRGLWIRPSRTVFFQDNFSSKLSTIRQQSPPDFAYANSLKGMRIYRAGSLAHAEGLTKSLSGICHIGKMLQIL